MADTAPNYKVGEIFEDCELVSAEYAGDIAAGDPLKVTGKNADSLPKVQKQTGMGKARYVAAYAGASGLITDVILRGTTKVKSIKKWAAGGLVSCHDGGFEIDASGTTSIPVGYGYGAVAADNDYTLIYFHGAMGR